MAALSTSDAQHLRPSFALTSFRLTVIAPGAFAEGVLVVLLPWWAIQATQGSAWMGLSSAMIVIAAILGHVMAPMATRTLGGRRMIISSAWGTSLALGISALLWCIEWRLTAFMTALLAVALDSMADVGFACRQPVLARLCRQPLMQFSAGNWLWGISGMILGSLYAGWCEKTDRTATALVLTAVAALVVALGLMLYLPPDRNRVRYKVHHQYISIQHAVQWRRWAPKVVLIAALTIWLHGVFGPLDNLLMPAHLASHGRDVDIFGMAVAAGGLGLAVGLIATQTELGAYIVKQRTLVLLGLSGVCLQVLLVWWMPSSIWLIAGVLVTSAMIAPLLPLFESALLLAATGSARTVVVSMVSAASSLADMVGTAVFGGVTGYAGTETALGLCMLMLLPMWVIACFWDTA